MGTHNEFGIFGAREPAAPRALPADVEIAGGPPPAPHVARSFSPAPDDYFVEVFERAQSPDDPIELRDLWLARVAERLGAGSGGGPAGVFWSGAPRRRTLDGDDVLTRRSTVRFIKELFNWYFRDDLYGRLRPRARYIMSGGTVREELWGLPEALKECLRYAVSRDWYGYSDSRGREAARAAVAEYENRRLGFEAYGPRNVALTLGGTHAISALADFILGGTPATAPSLVAIPNYPPLVESIARRGPTRLVPLETESGVYGVKPLIAAMEAATPLVMLQTVANPTGAVVHEESLTGLLESAGPATTVVLDECHEWLPQLGPGAASRVRSNVVRVTSLSKGWSVPGLKIGWILADESFVDEYYEYASTSFGGPPSIYFTLVEFLARMGSWEIAGVEAPDAAELDGLQADYRIQPDGLRQAYEHYRLERAERNADLAARRDHATRYLAAPGLRVHPPRQSINLTVELVDRQDSYVCFRELLDASGVSVYPGILNLCLSGAVARVTTALPWDELSPGLRGIRQAVAAG